MSFLTVAQLAPVTADGDYLFLQNIPGSSVIVEAGGEFGTAAIELGFLTISGAYKAYTAPNSSDPLTLSVDDPKGVRITSRGGVILRITGADGDTALQVAITRTLILSAN